MKNNIVILSIVFFSAFSWGGERPQKEWAFLIFLNGHNNLSEYGDININQLETVGSTNEIDVIVQWAKTGNDKTYRLKVEKDNDEKKVTSPIIEALPRVDMGDYKNMIDFIRWAHEHYPAKHYFISYWNHGSGWYEDRKEPTRGISYDDYSGNHITTPQMAITMREATKIIGHKVDIVGADACLMAMAEVGGEMQDSVDYFIASEDLEPALGWPYHIFFKHWSDHPTSTPVEITRTLVEDYVESLGHSRAVTLSSMDLSKLPNFLQSLKEFATKATGLEGSSFEKFMEKTASAIDFINSDSVDLGDALLKTKELSEMGEESATTSLQQELKDLMVASKASGSLTEAQGMAIWFPKDSYTYNKHINAYRNLEFVKATGWDKLLDKKFKN